MSPRACRPRAHGGGRPVRTSFVVGHHLWFVRRRRRREGHWRGAADGGGPDAVSCGRRRRVRQSRTCSARLNSSSAATNARAVFVTALAGPLDLDTGRRGSQCRPLRPYRVGQSGLQRGCAGAQRGPARDRRRRHLPGDDVETGAQATACVPLHGWRVRRDRRARAVRLAAFGSEPCLAGAEPGALTRDRRRALRAG